MTAHGVHALSDRKLGRRAEDKSKPKIALANVLATGVPAHPITDRGPQGITYPMDRNDEAGDCVVAGANHALQAIYALLGKPYTPWTDAQILAYYQTQNPDFRSWNDAGTDADGGMIIAQFLSYLVKKGVILGFAKVDHTKPEELKAAIYLGLCLVSGANMQQAQHSGRVWDYVPGSPDWGGHCTAQDGYLPDYQTISWGSDKYVMTANFMTHRVDEVYMLITQAHVDHPAFREGVDLDGFKAAFTQITGRPWDVSWDPAPAPTPPAPAPEPTPAPTPAPPVPTPPVPTPPAPTPPSGGGASFQVSAEVVARVAAAAGRSHLTQDAWLENHLRHYFNLI